MVSGSVDGEMVGGGVDGVSMVVVGTAVVASMVGGSVGGEW